MSKNRMFGNKYCPKIRGVGIIRFSRIVDVALSVYLISRGMILNAVQRSQIWSKIVYL